MLDGARGGEEEEEEQPLERLADRPRAGRRGEHEEMDVDAPVAAQRVPRLLRRLPAAREAAERGERDEARGRAARLAPGHGAEAERAAGGGLDRQRSPGMVVVRVVVVVSHARRMRGCRRAVNARHRRMDARVLSASSVRALFATR